MGTMIEVCKTDELKDGTMKKVAVQGKEILLARSNGQYYAAGNRCPHMGGDLSQGRLEGTVVTCPRHGSQFDITDGHVVRWTDFAGLVAKISNILKTPHQITTYTE